MLVHQTAPCGRRVCSHYPRLRHQPGSPFSHKYSDGIRRTLIVLECGYTQKPPSRVWKLPSRGPGSIVVP